MSLFTSHSLWSSFLSCCLIHGLLYAYSHNTTKSNLLTCWSFQVYFLVRTFQLTLRSLKKIVPKSICADTEHIFDTLSGYMLYDMSILLFHMNGILSFGYYIHHILSIMIVETLKQIGLHPSHVGIYNLFAFVIEFQSPLSHLVVLFNNTIIITYLKLAYFFAFTLFRMILFPILNYLVYIENKKIKPILASKIYVCFNLIYLLSIIYYVINFIL